MAGTATVESKPAAPAKGAPVRRFRAGVQQHLETYKTYNATLSAAGTTTFLDDVVSYGFLRGVFLKVTVTGGAGGSATYEEDAPWSLIQQVQLQDVNSVNIIAVITGYDLYLIMKYGGYYFSADPKQAEEYTQGGANGNPVFILYVPLEIRHRDCVGALPNKSSNTAYKLQIIVAGTNDIFVVNPVTPPTNARIDLILDAWWEPQPADLAGRTQADEPPSPDTVQYWMKANFTHAGAENITDQLKRLGYMYRNLIGTCRTTAPARSTTNFPNPLTIIYEGQAMTVPDRQLWRHLMARYFGYTATVETAGGLDTGVMVFPFNRDFGLSPGAEIGNGYLPTASGTRVEFQGAIGAAGTIQWLINDVSAVDELDITGP
ncbi:MAG: hypothetical protein ACM30G_23180 [Micromonosporaceae bacterium]